MDTVAFCRTLATRAKTVQGRQALFRKEMLPARYSGRLHIAFSVCLTAGLGAAAWICVGSWGLAELAGVAGSLFASMTVIYFSHRFPMHRSLPGATTIYDIHTRCHHMLFDRGETEIRGADDVYMVMLPPLWTAGLCVVGFPVLAAPLALYSVDVALAFLGFTYVYFLGYELVHLAAHAPAQSRVHRAPGLGYMLRHHQRHHAWGDMHRCNFSMIIPLWDLLLGTELAR